MKKEWCVGCHERIKWYEKKDALGRPWHFRCFEAWETGYDLAQKWAEDENRMAGYPKPWELYAKRCNNMYREVKQ